MAAGPPEDEPIITTRTQGQIVIAGLDQWNVGGKVIGVERVIVALAALEFADVDPTITVVVSLVVADLGNIALLGRAPRAGW